LADRSGTHGRRRRRPLLGAYAFLVYAFLTAPLVVVVVVSFSSSNYLDFPPPGFSLRWYGRFFESDELLDGFLLSLRIAAIATAAAVALGIVSAVVLVRHGRLRGVTALRGLFVGPLIVPYVILAQGLFYVNLELGLYGSVLSIVIAHVVIALPYVVILVASALYSVPRALEDAARGLGANGLVVFRRVTLPLILPSVVSAALFAFIVSWDEFILAFFLASPGVETLPVVVYNLLRETVDPTISAVSTLLMAITLLVVVASEYFQRAGTRAARAATAVAEDDSTDVALESQRNP
jgi:putative spermidine/putrescine transport system permease protein